VEGGEDEDAATAFCEQRHGHLRYGTLHDLWGKGGGVDGVEDGSGEDL
jgi:hypothetical protein